ncbi:MAG TPA: phospholipid scramblase-related protein [Gemmataceae bacterium]|nr:phospholipid scramblase-related protein [Gemmataceae bacterium]
MLNVNTYLVKQQAGLFKRTAAYDIFDANTNQQVGNAKERPSTLVNILRLFMNKQKLPTTVAFFEQGKDQPLFSIYRAFSLFRSKVQVLDAEGQVIGSFKSKIMSLGGGFWVYDAEEQQFAEVKGDWKGWSFKFLTTDGQELGTVGKKWAGMAKELFTSADNYVIALNDAAKGKKNSNLLLLAAGLAIDIIYNE